MTSGLNFEVSAPKSPPNMINSPKLQTKLSPGHNFQAINMKLIWKLKHHVLKAPTKFRYMTPGRFAGTQLFVFSLLGLRWADFTKIPLNLPILKNFAKTKVLGSPQLIKGHWTTTLWRCHGESLAAVGGKLASGLNFEVFGRNPKKVGKNFEVEIFFFRFSPF